METYFPDKFIYEKYDLRGGDPSENIKRFFKDAYEFISGGEVVFVHCHAGVSRSASIVISYLMKKYKKPFEEMKTLVKSKRPKIHPNSGFIP